MTGSSDICLKWNDHHGALLSLLYSQLQDKKVVDVTIAAQGKSINVHRLVLCASSPYFEDLLGQQHKPAIIILQDIKFCDVTLIIEYIYKGEVFVPEDQLASFLEAAKSLQIKGFPLKGNNPDRIQEPTVAAELPPEIKPTQDEAVIEPADDSDEERDEFFSLLDSDLNIALETEDNLNLPIQEGDSSVVIVDAPPRPAPEIVNLLLDESMNVEEEQVNNEDEDPVSNSSDDEDLSSSDSSDNEEREEHLQPAANGNHQGGANVFTCGTCGRDYQLFQLFRKHSIKKKCRFVLYFRCALCGVWKSNRTLLRYHLLSCHKNVSPSEFDRHIIEIKPGLPKFR